MGSQEDPRRDDALIERSLARGDRRALEAVYDRYGRTVFAFLVKQLGDRAAAEDVHQQVFAEVWTRAGNYDPKRGSLFTWVMAIARSRAIDDLRKRRPEPRDPSTTAELVESANGKNEFERTVERWHMASLLDRIPREESDILRMRFYEELTQREIADRTGIALGTVKMRMVQALERLRELIEREEL